MSLIFLSFPLVLWLCSQQSNTDEHVVPKVYKNTSPSTTIWLQLKHRLIPRLVSIQFMAHHGCPLSISVATSRELIQQGVTQQGTLKEPCHRLYMPHGALIKSLLNHALVSGLPALLLKWLWMPLCFIHPSSNVNLGNPNCSFLNCPHMGPCGYPSMLQNQE